MFSSFSRFKSILWSLVSKAEYKSMGITCVGVLLSMLCIPICYQKRRVELFQYNTISYIHIDIYQKDCYYLGGLLIVY